MIKDKNRTDIGTASKPYVWELHTKKNVIYKRSNAKNTAIFQQLFFTKKLTKEKYLKMPFNSYRNLET